MTGSSDPDTSYGSVQHTQNPTYTGYSAQQHYIVNPENPDIQTALADMLHAWYQSGYMTGRYQTLLELQAQQNQARNVETNSSENVASKSS